MQVFIWGSTHFADAGLPVPNCLFEVRTVSTKASLSVHLCVPSPDLDSGYHSIYCSSVKSLDSVLVSPDTCIQSLQVSQPCLICEIQVWSVKYVNSDLWTPICEICEVWFAKRELRSVKLVKSDLWNTSLTCEIHVKSDPKIDPTQWLTPGPADDQSIIPQLVT